MTLTPRQPPGRSSRKARAFEAEIRQLHAQGYSFEAIREALADAGIHVSKSTVQREMSRQARHLSAAALPINSRPVATAQPSVIGASCAQMPDARSGKAIAEAFVRNRITNPLLRRSEPR
jgi:hypothetical protein